MRLIRISSELESDTLPSFGLEVDESSWGLGDTYIRPLWRGWIFDRFEVGGFCGLYLPTGKYDAGEADKVGLGMCAHDFIANLSFYLPVAGAAGRWIAMMIGNSIHKESMA